MHSTPLPEPAAPPTPAPAATARPDNRLMHLRILRDETRRLRRAPEAEPAVHPRG